MFVSEILTEAKEALGRCADDVVFRRITDAVQLANNQGKFEVSLAIINLCVCDGCITLPADVAVVLACNNNGQPTLLRDEWYQFHANGTGDDCYTPWNYTDELGAVCTFRDPAKPVTLIAEVENAKDSNCTLRVFGWDDNGKRIYTEGAGGILEDGFLVPTVFGFVGPNPVVPPIARIERIQKQVTNGFVRLIAVDPISNHSHTLIGYYQPWETNPSYRRIRVPNRSEIRIKYRRKDIEVRSSADWININNRLALLLLLKSVIFSLNNSTQQAQQFEAEAIRLLSNEAEALRPPAQSGPQITWSAGLPAGPTDRLFY